MTATIYINREGMPPLESGQWAWVVNEEGQDPFYLVFGCPCGDNCGGASFAHNNYIAVTRGKSKDPHQWSWDGDWDTPTLTPSIQRRGGCSWHGYLRKGVFVSV